MKHWIWICLFFAGRLSAQDSAQEWFTGGDEGFYSYLSNRLMGLESQRPAINATGENVTFEIWISDSGIVDSSHIISCFNFNLATQLRLILNTMPRVNPAVEKGKTIRQHRVYNLILKTYIDGYMFEPNPYVPPTANNSTPKALKIGLAAAAVAGFLFILITR